MPLVEARLPSFFTTPVACKPGWEEGEHMDEQEMRRFVEEYIKALNAADAAEVERFHANESMTRSGGQPGVRMGRAERQQYFRQRRRAFPDFQLIATEINVAPRSGRASFDWEVTATHKGHFKGLPPTNKTVTHRGTTELQIKNGRIVSETSYQDIETFLNQLDMRVPVGAWADA
jgi:steroid delta-isomerase-like uncharacterized protein